MTAMSSLVEKKNKIKLEISPTVCHNKTCLGEIRLEQLHGTSLSSTFVNSSHVGWDSAVRGWFRVWFYHPQKGHSSSPLVQSTLDTTAHT